MGTSKTIIQDNQNKKQRQLISLFDHEDKSWSEYDNAQKFLDFINPVGGEITLSLKDTEVNKKALPFYKDVDLIKVSSLVDDEFTFFFLKADEEFLMLNGDSAIIQEINEMDKLKLTNDNVFDYLKFFCFFIETFDEEAGVVDSFYIIEGPDSEFIKGESEYQRKRCLRKYTGPRVISSADQKSFAIESRMIYAGSLFDTKFKISDKGDVTMTEDNYIGVL
jgi:hypothetical protein